MSTAGETPAAGNALSHGFVTTTSEEPSLHSTLLRSVGVVDEN
jgi:hypothetical protein